MKKTGIVTLIVSLFCLLILTSCEPIQPDIIVKTVENQDVSSFPSEIKFRYYLPENSSLVGKTYTLKRVYNRYGSDYYTYEVEKVDDGYKLLSGTNKGFVFKEPSELGYFAILEFPEQNGTLNVRFNNKDTYDLFISEFSERYGW